MARAGLARASAPPVGNAISRTVREYALGGCERSNASMWVAAPNARA
jgi:hypothetical protein